MEVESLGATAINHNVLEGEHELETAEAKYALARSGLVQLGIPDPALRIPKRRFIANEDCFAVLSRSRVHATEEHTWHPQCSVPVHLPHLRFAAAPADKGVGQVAAAIVNRYAELRLSGERRHVEDCVERRNNGPASVQPRANNQRPPTGESSDGQSSKRGARPEHGL